MKLDKEQKKIVKAIENKKITDIMSFVKYMDLGHEVQFDKSLVMKRFSNAYKGKRYVCETRSIKEHGKQKLILEERDDKTCYCKPYLEPYGHFETISFRDLEYKYSYFAPLYIVKGTDEIDKIISFIALWQYLKEQALIVEFPTSCAAEDVALFLKKTPDEDKYRDPLDENSERPYTFYEVNVPLRYFFNGSYDLYTEDFENCFPYLTKKIYPAPKLKTFIQDKHNTKEEINNRRNLRIALAGVIIALITSISSILVSVFDKGYHKELDMLNQSVQRLEETISENDASDSVVEQLEEINESLKTLEDSIPENQDTTDINEKLDGIIDAINKLQENTTNEKGTD